MLKNLVKQLFTARYANDRRHNAAPGAIPELLKAGVEAQARGSLREAEAAYRNVLAQEPGHADAQHLLGHVLRLQGRLEEAAEALRQRIKTAPDAAEAWYSLGDTLRAQRRFDEAVEAFGAAVSLQPGFAAGWLARGDALATLERLDEAEDTYVEALAREPGFAEAHHNYGNLLHREGRIGESIAAYRRALALKPDFVRAHSNLVYALNFSPAYTPEQIFAEHVEWARSHAAALGTGIRPRGDPPDPARRLRVGYVSPNFRDHAVAYFFEPALRHHDRTQFSIYLYSDVREPDARTARLRSYGDEWRDITGHPDAAVADLVRGDRIDLLVDLTGHTDGHRLLLFARKPAPLQITWNGYANTTGMQAMDYRITDGYADPPGMTERWHSEQLLRMPEIYMPFEPPVESPALNAPPVQVNGYITFGSFNALAKITPRLIELWSQILRSVADSRLLMLTVPDGRTRLNIVHAFAEHGISEARLKLVGRLPFGAFLAAHREADVALDPFPFNGTTTTCQSLWMGVPVITLAGASHAARVGVSILSNLGLQRLVARDAAEYVAIATALADAPADLAALRAGLRERMLRSPNTDGERYTRFLETAYRNIWRDWCRLHAA